MISALKDKEFALNTGGIRSIPNRGTNNEQGHSGVKLLLRAGTSDKRCLFQARPHITYFPGGGHGWSHNGIETMNHDEERKNS